MAPETDLMFGEGRGGAHSRGDGGTDTTPPQSRLSSDPGLGGSCGRLGAIGLPSTSRYLARGREVQHTQFVRSMATKSLVATTVAASWDWARLPLYIYLIAFQTHFIGESL